MKQIKRKKKGKKKECTKERKKERKIYFFIYRERKSTQSPITRDGKIQKRNKKRNQRGVDTSIL